MPHYERLSALDASFLEIESERSHMHVAATLLLDAKPLTDEHGALGFERIRDAIAARLHLVPRYRQRLAFIPVERHPVWVDDDRFNLDYHIRHTCLPRPGSIRLLQRLVGRIQSQKLDPHKPLWETWVVEGVEGERFALVSKSHHCMIDGVSGVDLLTVLLSPTPRPDSEPPPPWRARPAPREAELVAYELGRRAMQPLALAGRLAAAAVRPVETLTRAQQTLAGVASTLGQGMRGASPTPLNPAHIGPHRRFDWLRTSLADAKEVRHRAGGTLNDVVLATVAGAMGRFLRARGVDVDGLDFRAMVPVNVRPEKDRGALGNRVASIVASLPVAERDPLERLRRTREIMERAKRSGQIRGAEALEELADWTSTTLVTELVRLAVRARAYNLVVTNVPGPPFPVYLLNARLQEIYPMVPLYENNALGIALFSYDGQLHWGLNADWDAVPDLHDVVLALRAEFEALCKHAARLPPETAPPSPAAGRKRRPRRARA